MTTIKPSITQSAPDISAIPPVDFRKEEFENLILQKGYDVWHETAIKCPCRQPSTSGHQPLSDCDNCAGSGWFFINRTVTKMIITSMNNNTKYSEWSQEKLGTAALTARDVDELGEMDRITVIKGESQFTETIHPREVDGKIFSFCSYEILRLKYAFLFKGSKQKLVVLREGVDFTVENNKILLDKKFKKNLKQDNLSLSIRYTHRPTYHVLDIPRDVILTDILVQVENQRKPFKMPIHAIGRRAHFISDFDNLEGGRVFDNSTVQYPNIECK